MVVNKYKFLSVNKIVCHLSEIILIHYRIKVIYS